MNYLTIIIKGNPVPKQRARKGSHGNWYNPSSKDMDICRRQMREQLPVGFKVIPKTVPTRVDITFFFSPAKADKIKDIESDSMPFLKKRGDRDNCDKWILDSGNKLIWEDDAQIYAGEILKFYSNNPRTEINVSWEK
jgi:Holliday junction resolvase RusA-like endonuclease